MACHIFFSFLVGEDDDLPQVEPDTTVNMNPILHVFLSTPTVKTGVVFHTSQIAFLLFSFELTFQFAITVETKEPSVLYIFLMISVTFKPV